MSRAEAEHSAHVFSVLPDRWFVFSAVLPLALGFGMLLPTVNLMPFWIEQWQIAAGERTAWAWSLLGALLLPLGFVLLVGSTFALLWFGRADASADQGSWRHSAQDQLHQLERVALGLDGHLAVRVTGVWYTVENVRWRILSSQTLEWSGCLVGDAGQCANWSLRVPARWFRSGDWKCLMRVAVARLLRAGA